MLSQTVVELLRQSRLALGSLGDGMTISSEEADDDLLTLNILLAEWSVHGFVVYADVRETYALTASDAEYTWGSGGNIDTARPITLRDETFIRDSDIDYPVKIIGSSEYASISDKSTEARPTLVYMSPEFTLAKVYFYPTPDEVYTVHFTSVKELTTLATIYTTISMPPEYLSALKWNLAVALAPSYGLPVTPLVMALAERSLKVIKRKNANDRLEAMRQNLFSRDGSIYLDHIEGG